MEFIPFEQTSEYKMDSNQGNSIWLVDDDVDDHELVQEIFNDLNWDFKLEVFKSGDEMLERLEAVSTAPFLIISDVNLPKMDGFALRERTLKSASNKFHSVPFIFWSTDGSEQQVRKAYRLQSHGFFRKEPNYENWKKTLVKIVDYWTSSLTPSKEDGPDKPLA